MQVPTPMVVQLLDPAAFDAAALATFPWFTYTDVNDTSVAQLHLPPDPPPPFDLATLGSAWSLERHCGHASRLRWARVRPVVVLRALATAGRASVRRAADRSTEAAAADDDDPAVAAAVKTGALLALLFRRTCNELFIEVMRFV